MLGAGGQWLYISNQFCVINTWKVKEFPIPCNNVKFGEAFRRVAGAAIHQVLRQSLDFFGDNGLFDSAWYPLTEFFGL